MARTGPVCVCGVCVEKRRDRKEEKREGEKEGHSKSDGLRWRERRRDRGSDTTSSHSLTAELYIYPHNFKNITFLSVLTPWVNSSYSIIPFLQSSNCEVTPN